jgi:hypothetical protein
MTTTTATCRPGCDGWTRRYGKLVRCPNCPPADLHLQDAHGPILTRGDLERAQAEHAQDCAYKAGVTKWCRANGFKPAANPAWLDRGRARVAFDDTQLCLFVFSKPNGDGWLAWDAKLTGAPLSVVAAMITSAVENAS